MFLIKLDADYLPLATIEGYKSLIWTERYRDAGDFSLKTLSIEATLKALPLNTLVSHLDTAEVMIVESYTIDLNSDRKKELTITGRTFETFYENRPARPWSNSTGAYLELHDDGTTDTSEDSVEYAYENVTLGYALRDMMAQWTVSGWAEKYGAVIPKYGVRDDTTNKEKLDNTVIELGSIYQRVLELLEVDDLGIRNARPGADGEKEKTPNLLTRIYEGVDRTESVLMSTQADHFITGSYLKTVVGEKTAAAAFSYYRVDTWESGTQKGRFKKIGIVDVTRLKKKVYTSAELTNLRTRAKAYVKRRQSKFIFSGQVAPTIPYKYLKHYRLGDIVRVKADYGVDQSMRVVEYIRTEDSTGDQAYPSLELLGT